MNLDDNYPKCTSYFLPYTIDYGFMVSSYNIIVIKLSSTVISAMQGL